MDERYRIILTIKDDLPFVAKEFEPETTLDEAIQWMKDNRKELYISTNDWFERVLDGALKFSTDTFLPVGRILDQKGERHFVFLKLDRKQADHDHAPIKVKLFDVDRIRESLDSEIKTLPSNKHSIDELDKIFGDINNENERTT